MIALFQKKTGIVPESMQPQDNCECCVLCGAMTDILRSEHIDLRYGYVEGAGQLCRKCYHELFGDRGGE